MLKLQRDSYRRLHFQPKRAKRIHHDEPRHRYTALTCHIFPGWTLANMQRGTVRFIQHDVALTKVVIRGRVLHVVQHLLGQVLQLILWSEGGSIWCWARTRVPALGREEHASHEVSGWAYPTPWSMIASHFKDNSWLLFFSTKVFGRIHVPLNEMKTCLFQSLIKDNILTLSEAGWHTSSDING